MISRANQIGIIIDVLCTASLWHSVLSLIPACFCGPLLLGSLGGVKLDPFSFHTTIGDTELDCTGDLENMDFRWTHTEPKEYAYTSSEAHWIAALTGEVELLPTAELALQTMLIQEGIVLSSKLGREVTAEEVMDASQSLMMPL